MHSSRQSGGRTGGRPSLAAKVIETLAEQIENGDYAVGDKLPTEPVLVERFGVSRTVIREAIAALRAEGLLESKQGIGVFALGPRQSSAPLALFTEATSRISDLIEEMEIRIGVEVEAAGLAALRSSPAQEADLEAQLQVFARLVEEGKSTDQADFDFHIAVATATNNKRFKSFLDHVGRRIIPRVKFRNLMGGVDPLPNRDDILLAEHVEVAEAIWARDPERARAAMRKHLLGGIKRYRALTRPGLARTPDLVDDPSSS